MHSWLYLQTKLSSFTVTQLYISGSVFVLIVTGMPLLHLFHILAPILQQGHARNVWQHPPQDIGDAPWGFQHSLVSSAGSAGKRRHTPTGVSGWFCKWYYAMCPSRKLSSFLLGLPLVAVAINSWYTINNFLCSNFNQIYWNKINLLCIFTFSEWNQSTQLFLLH